MNLTVRTLRGGPLPVSGLPDSISFYQLRAILHERFPKAAVPPPERQRLIYKNEVMADEETLAGAGITNGDTLVMLCVPDPPRTLPEDTTPAPDIAAIRTAISAEARRRGTEVQFTEEPAPSQARRAILNVSGQEATEMDQRLLQLLEALEGRLGVARNGDGGVGVPSAAAGSAAALAAAAQAGQVEILMIPEPDAEGLRQLADMGFSEILARKALILSRNQVSAAAEWLLLHGEEEDAGAPPTQEQLRQVYGRGQGRRALAAAVTPSSVEAMPDMIAQLVDMGFPQDRAAAALGRYPNVEAALAWLLQHDSSAEAAPLPQPPHPPPPPLASDSHAALAATTSNAPAGGSLSPEPEAASPAPVAVTTAMVDDDAYHNDIFEEAYDDGERAERLQSDDEDGSMHDATEHGEAADEQLAQHDPDDAAAQEAGSEWAPGLNPAMVQQLLDGMLAAFGGASEGDDDGGGDESSAGLQSLLQRLSDATTQYGDVDVARDNDGFRGINPSSAGL